MTSITSKYWRRPAMLRGDEHREARAAPNNRQILLKTDLDFISTQKPSLL